MDHFGDRGKRKADETEETASTDGRSTSRRGWLQGLMATGIVGGVMTTGAQTASASDGQYSDQFGTVVNVVEAGADNTGQESVTPILQELVDNDTLLVFPPGRYYMDEQVRLTSFWNLGLVGHDATLVPANYHNFDGPQYRLFRLGVGYAPGNELLIDGFTVDQTAADTGIRAFEATVTDGLEVRDILIKGKHDSGTWGPGSFNVVDPNGRGIVERFRAPDGADWVSTTPNDGNLWRGPTGILANQNQGTLRFKDCVVGAFPDNGLYAAGGTGQIIVDGGRFENSNASSLRVGGTDSVIKGATVRIDQQPPHFNEQRGLRVENNNKIRVKDTDVTVTVSNAGCTGVKTQNSCGELWMKNVNVTVDSDKVNSAISIAPETGFVTLWKSMIELNTPGGYALQMRGPSSDSGANLEYVKIVDNAGDKNARAGIRNTRDDVRLSHVTIDQPGGEKRYGLVNLANDCTIYNCDFTASKYPVLDAGEGTWVEQNHMESYRDNEAYALHDDSRNVYLKNNKLVDGIADYGCEGLKTRGNVF